MQHRAQGAVRRRPCPHESEAQQRGWISSIHMEGASPKQAPATLTIFAVCAEMRPRDCVPFGIRISVPISASGLTAPASPWVT